MKAQNPKRTNEISNPRPSGKKKTVLAALGIGAAILVTVAAMNWDTIGFVGRALLTQNYAEQAAIPLEKALEKAGAVKQCGRGDNGRGIDNTEPWYYVIVEVPGNKEAAAEVLKIAAKESGFNLGPGDLPTNPEDNQFFADKTSKPSPYSDLQSGNVELRVTAWGSKVYNEGGHFCGVTQVDTPSADKTTMTLTFNLPEFKR